MCGIFGAIGKGYSKRYLRALAGLNQSRGAHGTGFVNHKLHILKSNKPAVDFLGSPEFSVYEEKSGGSWFMLGHTRHATQGDKTAENCHPFRYGRYVGMHNGIVMDGRAKNYAVDSELLVDLLESRDGNYIDALGDVDGYWGLAWTDGHCVYLQNYWAELAICRVGKVWYYSSDARHLTAIFGRSCELFEVGDDGQTFCFDGKDILELPRLQVYAERRYDLQDWRDEEIEDYDGWYYDRDSGTIKSHLDDISNPER